jgi:prepilin peptidase CpaA
MAPAWQFGLVGILAVALVTDLQSRKIYNWLTFPAILVGLLLGTLMGGLPGLQSAGLGLLVGSAVFLVGFMLGAMGAGDVKLMAAVGAWLGWPSAIAAVLYVTVLGGLVSLGAAAAHGSLLQLFRNIYWFFVGLILPGGKAQAAVAHSAAPPIPYGVSIALGSLLALFFPEPQDLLAWVRA